ncbi:MAG TPA: hypothetical protein VE890_10850 [Thermoguttaceae bacterium]|nr:hypothetical protein [Thermoguttaceae bacterium]
MNRLLAAVAVLGLVLTVVSPLNAAVTTFDFDDAWGADYAPGWENSAYRHGDPPIGKMMQHTTIAHSGGGGMKLVADSTPESWMWWAYTNVKNVNPEAMKKQYDPYISVWYYDQGDSGGRDAAGQMFAVPSWVNPYIAGDEDWTDVQFGARDNVGAEDLYYYVAVGENHPGWVPTTVARPLSDDPQWVNLKMQLDSTDGYIHFYIDDVEVGQSYRSDYLDLGTEVGLGTRFAAPLANWGEDKPYSIWDEYTIGSTYQGKMLIPEPASVIVWSTLGLLGITIGWWRRRRTA